MEEGEDSPSHLPISLGGNTGRSEREGKNQRYRERQAAFSKVSPIPECLYLHQSCAPGISSGVWAVMRLTQNTGQRDK